MEVGLCWGLLEFALFFLLSFFRHLSAFPILFELLWRSLRKVSGESYG